jgi:hypothetical protein
MPQTRTVQSLSHLFFSNIFWDGLLCEISSSHAVNQSYLLFYVGSVERKILWRKQLWRQFVVDYFLTLAVVISPQRRNVS